MAERVTKRTRHRSFSTAFILGFSVIVAASCVADNDEPLPALESSRAPLASPALNLPEVQLLRRTFPDHADRVLGTEVARGFVLADQFFVREPNRSVLVHLDVQLSKNSQDPVRLTAPGGHEIRVRQVGVEGEGRLLDRAVAYRRARGTSFWTVTNGGAEEWLHLEAGAVTSDLDIAAEWEIEGATPVLMNHAVALMDDEGVARAWVTAPEAYGAEGRSVDLRLSVEGQRIELFADARGEEVLLDPGWVAVAPIFGGLYATTATTLPSGLVLFANGYDGATIPSTTQLYNPATNMWTPGPSMSRGRYAPAAVLLNDGRVMVVGGQSNVTYESSIELYDPATNTWSTGAPMATGRGLPTAVLLADGRVLVAGGYNGSIFLATAQIYNPMTNSWSNAGNMFTARAWSHGVRLDDGRVLIAGGINTSITTPIALASAEIFNPSTNTWSSAGNMLAPRYLAGVSLLPNGQVLVAGGVDNSGEGITNSDLFNPATNSWTATSPLPTPMSAQAAVLLGTGHFMSAAGYGFGATNSGSATYDPATGMWTNTGNVNVGRYLGATTKLANGDAIFISGTTNGMAVTGAVDLYSAGTPANLADGSPCQTGGQCSSGFCVDGVCCNSACDSGACDACSVAAGATGDGVCQSLTGNTCDDGNACTQTDTCNAGTCTGANAIVCSALDPCHDPGVCNPATGLCSDPPKPNGTACNDNSACTQTDQCQNGICTGTNQVVCFIMDQCHTVGTCNPTTGECSNPRKPDGTLCNDNNACNSMDTCQAGVCTGSDPIKCVAQDQCHDVGTCNPSTGVCSNPLKANGALCDDGNACTQLDTCQAGTCTGSMPTVCTASDQCHTAGFCDAISGVCSNPIKANGSACNDGDACTKKDTCNAGVCTGTNPVICSPSDSCHDLGTCDPATGMCSNPVKADGAACDDNDKCTQTDTCNAGECFGGDPLACAPSDQCHDAGTCDPTTGMCSNPNKADGTACSDEDKCTEGDTCQAGICNGTMPMPCAPQDECHEAGTCDAATGMCNNPAKADGSPCSGGVCQSGECKLESGVGGAGNSSSSSTGGSGGSSTDPGGCGCRIADAEESMNSSAYAGLAFAAMALLRRRRNGEQRSR